MRVGRQTDLSIEVELGDLTVTMLSDGETAVPVTHLVGPGDDLAGDDLEGADLEGGKLPLPVRAFLVRGPAGCLLIDAGAGDAWHPTLGRLPEALGAAGVSPNAVTAIALTHTHIDHLGGLVTPDRALAFPNATRVWVATEELSAFRALPRMQPLVPRLMPLEQGDGPMRGVTAINAPGHSPGHMAFLVEGRMLIWGDLVHHAAIQFARPGISWTFDDDRFDDDPEAARATRLQLMDQAVDKGLIVAGAHLPGPGIGRITRAGAGFAFHPVSRTA